MQQYADPFDTVLRNHGGFQSPEEHPGKVGNMIYSPDHLFAHI